MRTPARTLSAAGCLAASVVVLGCGGAEPRETRPDAPAQLGALGNDKDKFDGVSGSASIEDIRVGPQGFSPRRTLTRAGSPIRFVNRGTAAYTITSTADSAQRISAARIAPGESFNITAREAGRVSYTAVGAGGKKFAGRIDVY